MEENTNENIQENKKENRVCFESHCWKKCLAMICGAFLGGFLAFYFVADQVMYRHHHNRFDLDRFEQSMFDDMDRIYLKDLHSAEKSFEPKKHIMPRLGRDKFDIPFLSVNPVKIKTETDNDKYNIIVCLKPFQNDENKINYDIQPEKITIYGSSQTKHKNVEENVSFSQDFLLPQNADIDNITKTKDGKKLIISIPLKD